MSDEDRVKWDQRYREADPEPAEPSHFLRAVHERLPAGGRALDVAGGRGHNAVWLAERGLDVTLVDISPLGMELARAHAAACGVTLATQQADLERQPLPPGPWELVFCSYFLRRNLFAHWAEVLRPGGLLAFVQPTHSNLQRHDRPPRDFLLADGELPGLVQGLEIELYTEGWTDSGRHEARLLARKA